MNVVVGAPIYRRGAYVLDRFILNQREIQREDPSCELVLATNETDFADELERVLRHCGLKGRAIRYETIKPDHARTRAWNVACGREAIRKHILSQTEAGCYMSVDADMVYDHAVTKIMAKELEGFDIIFSGSPSRFGGIGLTGAACMMVSRRALEKIEFRCVEFGNGQWMTEDDILEMDSFRRGLRIRKGVFLHASHYMREGEVTHVTPQPVGMYRRILTSAFVRYLLIRLSLAVGRNIPTTLWRTKARLRAKGSQYAKTPAD